MTYNRKCINWLDTLLEAYLPTSESPESMLFFSGLFTLACGLRRHVSIPRGLLGQYEIYPSLFVVFVAPPGVARKSTTSGIAEDFLTQIGGAPTKSPTNITLQKMIDMLAKSPDTSLWMISSELSTTVNKAGPEFFDSLTDLFDGRKSIDDATLMRNVVLAVNPAVNFMASTTPVSINNGTIPPHILAGGFGSRTLFIYENKARHRQLFYHKVKHADIYDKLKLDLIADLEHIANDIWGEFKIDDDAEEFMEDYYQNKIPDQVTGEARKIDGYYSRKHIHILKIAQLLHIAYSDELILTIEDVKQSIKILDQVEPKMLAAFKSLGKNRYTTDMEGILKYMEEKRRVPRSTLLEEFSASAEPAMLMQLIIGLQAQGKLGMEMLDDGNTWYYLTPSI